jgi:hypothetical protein
MLSGRGLCDGLITRPEGSYRLWCVLVCDPGTSRMRRLELIKGCKCRIEENNTETTRLYSLSVYVNTSEVLTLARICAKNLPYITVCLL